MYVLFKEIKSHQNKALKLHILEVRNISEKMLDIFGPDNENKRIYYINILNILSFFHDLGKMRKKFQKALEEEKKPPPHSLLSAILFSLFSKTVFDKIYSEGEEISKSKEEISFLYTLIYYIIKNHHSSPSENLLDAVYMYNKNNDAENDLEKRSWKFNLEVFLEELEENLKERLSIIKNANESLKHRKKSQKAQYKDRYSEEIELVQLILSEDFLDFFKNYFSIEKSNEEIFRDVYRSCLSLISIFLNKGKFFENKKGEKILADYIVDYIYNQKDYLSLSRNIRKESYERYIDFLFLYSIFFLSDKLSASLENDNYNDINELIHKFYKIFNKETYIKLREKFDRYIIENFEKEEVKNESKINSERSKQREKIFQEYKRNEKKRIFRISLPTGMGKTYIAMKIALDVCSKEGIPIIYSLPYINLIDQIYYRFSEIFQDEDKSYCKYVSEFHHLIDISRYTEGEESFYYEILNFNLAPITVTSFVQIFEALFISSKRMILKTPILFNSFLIIDEVQFINPEYYYHIEEIINTLIKMGFRIRVIIMSATLPALFSKKRFEGFDSYVSDLTLGNEFLYRMFDRYKLIFREKDKELSEYIEELKNEIERNDTYKKFLILTNEVKTAISIYKSLKKYFNIQKNFYIETSDISLETKTIRKNLKEELTEEEKKHLDNLDELIKSLKESIDKTIRKLGVVFSYNEESGILLLYLASNLINYIKRERTKFLNLLKDINFVEEKIESKGFLEIIKKIKKIVVISTQVIEAGVDVSFDIIFRDFAPVDSIIQTAGRVNRNYESSEPKKVIITKVSIKDGKEKFTHERIYSKYLISSTNNILRELKNSKKHQTNQSIEISECEVYDVLLVKYLEELNKTLEELDNYIKYNPGYNKSRELFFTLKFKEIRNNFKLIDDGGLYDEILVDFLNEIEVKKEKIKKFISEKFKNRYYLRKKLFSEFYKTDYKVLENVKSRIFSKSFSSGKKEQKVKKKTEEITIKDITEEITIKDINYLYSPEYGLYPKDNLDDYYIVV